MKHLHLIRVLNFLNRYRAYSIYSFFNFKEKYCANLVGKLHDVGGPVIENLLKPIFLGKILYTPKTNGTLQIISKVCLKILK